MQLLVQSPGKFVFVIQNIVTKTYPKIVMLHSFFEIFKKCYKYVKKIEKIHIDSAKSINSFEMEKDRSRNYGAICF